RYRTPPALLSSPTRRSSDLYQAQRAMRACGSAAVRAAARPRPLPRASKIDRSRRISRSVPRAGAMVVGGRQAGVLYKTEAGPTRSEEHTSELQSRVELVCRL